MLEPIDNPEFQTVNRGYNAVFRPSPVTPGRAFVTAAGAQAVNARKTTAYKNKHAPARR